MSSENTNATEERRLAIVDSAAALFDERGYGNASMGSVAVAAGLAKPTLYHYFPSGKAEILFRIHERFISFLIDRHRERLGAGVPPAEELKAIMTDVLEVIDRQPGHVRVFFENFRDLPEGMSNAVHAERDRYQAMVEDVLRSGAEAGVFRKLDPRLTAVTIFGMCNWAYQWYRPSGDLEFQYVAEFMYDLLMRGLAP